MPNRASITGSELFIAEEFQNYYKFLRSAISIEYGVTGIKDYVPAHNTVYSKETDTCNENSKHS